LINRFDRIHLLIRHEAPLPGAHPLLLLLLLLLLLHRHHLVARCRGCSRLIGVVRLASAAGAAAEQVHVPPRGGCLLVLVGRGMMVSECNGFGR